MENKFKEIKTKKEYMDLRLNLQNSMLLFFAYDSDKDNTHWFEYLQELKEKFPDHLEIVLFNNKSEENLVKVLLLEDSNEVEYPSVVFCHPHVIEAQIVNNFAPFELYKIIEEYDHFYKHEFEKEKVDIFERIKKILAMFPVVTFIKGTPHDPFCKYSRSFIDLITAQQIRYKSYNIFKDEKLRCYLRLYSGWKTYPQIYVNGKIIGGVDKVKELIESGEFLSLIPDDCKMKNEQK